MQDSDRTPRVRATLGGSRLAGLIAAELDSNNYFAADRFHLRFAASIVQQELLHIPGVELEVEIGLHDRWISIVVGQIDHVSLNPITGTVDVEGRDLSAQLIEAQTDETFANRTASEIAILLGARHGLAVLATPTSMPVGRYYQSEHDRVTLGQFAKTMSEWDLLAYLAAREGYDLFMTGRTLCFGLPLNEVEKLMRPVDCISLQLGHAIGLARPVDVLVRSWSSKTGEVATGHAMAVGVGPIWRRFITRPNLTSASAQQQAQRIVDDLKRHQWTATITMPGEFELTARSRVWLDDTGSPWDRAYKVTQISRRIDIQRGFTQSLSLQGIV